MRNQNFQSEAHEHDLFRVQFKKKINLSLQSIESNNLSADDLKNSQTQ